MLLFRSLTSRSSRTLVQTCRLLTSSSQNGESPKEITDTKKSFSDAFSHLAKTLTHEEDEGLKPVMNHLQKVLDYNVPHGKQIRGISTVAAYQLLVDKQAAIKEEIYLVHLLGWCLELENVGMLAINDAMLLESGIYKILRKCFRDHRNYVHLVELFHEMSAKTLFGQGLDMLTSDPSRPVDLEKFNETTYSTIVEYKTAYYTCYMPVALALYMGGITNANVHVQAKELLLRMGHLFQVQDDYMGCFADAQVMGKVDNDIQEGKCTWLIVTGAKIANPTQRKVLQDNYGYNDAERSLKVMNMYQELGLPAMYSAYVQENSKILENRINLLASNQTHKCLIPVLNLMKTLFVRKI